MRKTNRIAALLILALGVTAGLWAQRPGGGPGMMANLPAMPGLQNPTLGSGAEYVITSKGKQMDIATVTLGKEDVDGATGYWMEQRISGDQLGGEMVMKTLTVISDTQSGIKRMIMQRPGQAPIEMSGFMMSMISQRQPPPTTTPGSAGGKADMGELVGTESITVPAGTFTCQHYRKQGTNGPTDIWVSTQVTPYAVVKMAGADMTMELKKILSNETTHIKGEPQKMPDMPHFQAGPQ